MEEELKCPACRNFLNEPILLHCAHSYCRQCAIQAQVKVSTSNSNLNSNTTVQFSPPNASTSGASDSISLCISDADQESNDDKISVVSETDSGVVVYAGSKGSRPNSYLGLSSSNNFSSCNPKLCNVNTSVPISRLQTSKNNNTPTQLTASNSLVLAILSPSTSGYVLVCKTCHKPSYFPDENYLKNAKENLALKRLLQRVNFKKNTNSAKTNIYSETTNTKISKCQWCEKTTPNVAKTYCENCGYFYCESCQPIIHPSRGPLKSHQLILVNLASKTSNGDTLKRNLTTCVENTLTDSTNSYQNNVSFFDENDLVKEKYCTAHLNEILTHYCEVCRCAICVKCLSSSELRHVNHEVQNITSATKAQKTELSQTLQLLSEKAKVARDDITKLKNYNEIINNNCKDFKTRLNHEFDMLAQLLEFRRQKLLDFVEKEREKKRVIVREQLTRCLQHLSQTTSLIQFSIELLKEPDPIVYLQIGNTLSNRVTNQEFLWNREMQTKPEVDSNFLFDLDISNVEYALQTIDFTQFKVPSAPCFDPAECLAENNTVMLTWHCPNTNAIIDAYSLEIDSGWNDSPFKEVYCGSENVCTIDGLHFNTLYNARVKALNSMGESPYSESICLQTAHVAWFQLANEIGQNNPTLVEKNDLLFDNNFTTVTGTTMEYRSCVGSVGFSKGIHYWEVSIERYEGNADIVVGVAQSLFDTRLMLGKDLYGWSMYIDEERSWFLHNNTHQSRQNCGLSKSMSKELSNKTNKNHSCIDTVIGVLLDCDQNSLSFFINDSSAFTCAFRNMPKGIYYPAFSVNRNSMIAIHTGIYPPSKVIKNLKQANELKKTT